MKTKHLLTLVFAAVASIAANGQERGDAIIQAGGGWTSIAVENSSSKTSGYLINLSMEKFNSDKFAIGASAHYLYGTQNTSSTLGSVTENDKISVWSIPIYFDAKYYFATGKVKPFVKGSLGYQFSGRKIDTSTTNSTTGKTTTGSVTAGDGGLSVGAGTGLLFAVSEKVMLGVDYQWYWINNVYYQEASINTVSLNLGIKMSK